MTVNGGLRTFLFACLAGLLAPACADTLVGKVVAVVDGDTITVLDEDNQQFRVRLNGIDAPEKGQAFGQSCKESLSALAFGKVVVVEWFKTDRYGRVLGKVLSGSTDINLKQITNGCAWHYKKYQADQLPADRTIYAEAEVMARERKVGLWEDPSPLAPWEWRHRAK